MVATELVGRQWKDSKGRTWEVVEYLGFGKVMVRTTDLRCVGEMQAKSVQKLIEAAK